ncbi:MAG: aminodeoxychorismate/anthranilate synthase component II [Leptonema sp. (in: Bacteria)]|nr:aminodeoxychorismate/anthranilate synthase component II [Leptonema sp. (in: bacteria)]
MKILIIDNYDSFTYNLYQCFGEILEEEYDEGAVGFGDDSILDVKRNDEITIQEILKRKYDHIVISPGPGHPADSAYFGVCSSVLSDLAQDIPVLGVCLGMQGMASVYGGQVVRAKLPMHGKTSQIWHDEKGVFRNLPTGLSVMRYHSLIVDINTLPDCFEITSKSVDSDELMGIRHRDISHFEGIQFHPESFATEGGVEMLRNFLFNGA